MQKDSAFQGMALPVVLDISAAPAVHRELLKQIQTSSGALHLDGSKVERATTPGIQLLIAADVYARTNGREFSIVQPSVALKAAVAEMGMEVADIFKEKTS